MEIKKDDIVLVNGIISESQQLELDYVVIKVYNDSSSCLCRALLDDVYEEIDGMKNRIINFNQITKIKDTKDEK